MKNYGVSVLIVMLTLFASSLHAQDKKDFDAANSITREELKDHLFYLASDELEGRYADSAGYKIAANYVISQMRRAGLNPLFEDDNGKRSYKQYVPIYKRHISSSADHRINSKNYSKKILNGIDFKIPYLGRPEKFESPLKMVFAGFGIEEPEHGWNDYDGLDIDGKALILMMDAPLENGKPVLPKEIHKLYMGNPGLNRKLAIASEKNPALIILVPNLILDKAFDTWQSKIDYTEYFPQKPIGTLNLAVVRRSLIEFLFKGHEYVPPASNEINLADYNCFDLAGTTLELSFSVHDDIFYSPNVGAILEGNDVELRDEFIVISAHLDHVPPVDGQICNGADDNASGSSGLLEIAEALSMDPPKRSILILFFAAEELGLFGSKHFVANCPVDLKHVVANINLDMIGRTDPDLESSRGIYVVTSKVEDNCPELEDVISNINSNSIKWHLVFENKDNAFTRSDQIIFHDSGIPVALFYSGDHEDYHKPTDDAGKIDFEKIESISRLVFKITTDLADRKDRLCEPSK